MRRIFVFGLLFSVFQLFSFSIFVFAQPPQSENFQITKSVIDAGGAASSSENFRLTSAFGQPSPLGAQTSESFQAWPGFLTPLIEISPLSPIQALVIQATPPNVTLAWERITGANSYNVYRASSAAFTPGPLSFVEAVADTFYVTTPAAEKYFYIITASTNEPPGARHQEAKTPGSQEAKNR
ncbi:MAG: hypothetical protein PHI18_04060 [bacterium]|nr:hypothetical protein [bacterium]